MQNLQGRTAVITGAGSGIGLALARRAAASGMRLVLADIDTTALAAATASLALPDERVLARRVDVSLADEVQALVDAAFERFGEVGLVFNNAGVALSGRAWELSLSDWEWVLGVNLWSVVHGIRAFAPRLIAQPLESRIINTASAAGLVSTPGMAAYNVSKHGVVTLSETLRSDLATAAPQVGVSVLCPAWVPTNISTAGRNRQERFGPAADLSPEALAAAANSAKAVKSGKLTADDVAALTFEAIQAGDFYIIPHKRMGASIRDRMEGLLAACIGDEGAAA
jgi:NAD(P)-dependent dehydrogenase (short-subunit alcohol dehydrogenase family)